MSRVAKRYARALFNLNASDLVKASTHRAALRGLRELFDMKEAGQVLKSPVMPAALKRDLLHYGLDRVGADADIRKLAEYLLTAGRVGLLDKVALEYDAIMDDAEGNVQAQVMSAAPLSSEDAHAIASALGALLKRQVQVKQEVDRTLLGGFIVQVGQYRVDLSLRTRLSGLAAAAVQDTIVKGTPG